MDEEDAEDPLVSCTPVNVDSHKTHDPNRNPDTHIQPPAAQKRENAMRDAPKTTVLMRLSQFHIQKLHQAGLDFEKARGGHDYAKRVWWEFNKAFGTLPEADGNKKPWTNPTEKKLSDVWEHVDALHHFAPNHFLNISDTCHDPTDASLYKIDGSFIHESDREAIIPGYPNWAEMQVLVEFKKGGARSDPFDDIAGHDPDAEAKTRREVRGQIMSYAERLFSYQHRHAAFLLLVNGDTFRVMCWDRSGVAVTEAINYVGTVEGTQALLRVTYALSKLSRVKQGFDPTATRLLEGTCGWKRMDVLADPCEHDLDFNEHLIEGDVHEVFANPEESSTYGALSGDNTDLHCDPTSPCSDHTTPPPAVPVLSHVRKLFRDSLVAGFPRYRLTVKGHDYLVAKHIFMASGMIGRGTRGYVALEWTTQRFVFLKDSWRAFYSGVESEGEILSKLNEEGIQYVPTVVCHGDVFFPDDDDVEVVAEQHANAKGEEAEGAEDGAIGDREADPGPAAGDAAGVRLVDADVCREDGTEMDKREDAMETDMHEHGMQTGNQEGGMQTDNQEDRVKTDEDSKRRGPRVQETENARYHPRKGSKHVDCNLPPYLVKQPSMHENWVRNGVVQPKPIEKGTTSCTLPGRNVEPPTATSPVADSMPDLPVYSEDSAVTAPSSAALPSNPEPSRAKRSFAVMLEQNQGTGLRRMVHTRLVVKEICLPLTAFTSSKQLVRILYGCITAHGLAWQKCKYMHRDVSAGNLLIYPHVRRTADGRYRVYWQGILADWELAKHASKTVAMQPQRTGTWHFMSAYLLDNPGMPTTIADELEAFLHVLIYGLVRRVRSNLSSIQKFLSEYFAGCSFIAGDDRVRTPNAKRDSVAIRATLNISNDPITFSTPNREVVQGHPINKLISELLKIFRSRYVVLDWQKRPEPQALEATPTREDDNDYVDEPPPETTFGAVSDPSSEDTEDRSVTVPTPQDYKNVEALNDHALIANIFHRYMTSKAFPYEDVIPDRQNEIIIPQFMFQSPAVQTGASNSASAKKARTVKRKSAKGPSAAKAPKTADPEPPLLSELPQAPELDVALMSEAHEDAPAPSDPSLGRPAKRRRTGPYVSESDSAPTEAPVAESSMWPVKDDVVLPQIMLPSPVVAGSPKSEGPALDNAETLEPEDVVMDSEEAKLDDGSAVADAPQPEHPPIPSDPPQAQDHDDAAPMTEAHADDSAAPEPTLGRPTTRRRKGPVAKKSAPSELPIAESSTRRVTRSRTAANAASDAPAAAVPAAALLSPPAPPAAVPTADSNAQAATAIQSSTRVTRSKTGKLPAAPGGQADAAALSGATTKRGTGTRSATAARTTNKSQPRTQTRRRVAAAAPTEGTQTQPTGRRTRSRRS